MNSDKDNLAPAHGCLVGIALGVVIWGLIALVVCSKLS
jgi:hypothetical protein